MSRQVGVALGVASVVIAQVALSQLGMPVVLLDSTSATSVQSHNMHRFATKTDRT